MRQSTDMKFTSNFCTVENLSWLEYGLNEASRLGNFRFNDLKKNEIFAREFHSQFCLFRRIVDNY